MSDFHGFPVCSLSNPYVELHCLSTAGPRIVRLKFKGSDNLLAAVPEVSVPTPFGDYHYLGGHRLWHAPESAPRSYVPDDAGLEGVGEIPAGLVLNGKVEPATGIRKRIEIRLDPNSPRVELIHTLTNEGLWELELAPWAITMFRLGGTAVLPLRLGEGKEEELLPDRNVSLWPYSHTGDPRLQLLDEFIVIRALPDLPPLKIGAFNPRGWTAYCLGEILVRKTFSVQAGLPHPDRGCNAEIYCDSHFIELETLGPLQRLAPGDSLTLNENWELADLANQELIPQRVIELIRTDRD